jgi:hypothetical protein
MVANNVSFSNIGWLWRSVVSASEKNKKLVGEVNLVRKTFSVNHTEKFEIKKKSYHLLSII